MKTVKDAVKDFNGVWPTDTKNTNYYIAGSFLNIFYEIDGVLKHVCRKKEFERYAKEQKQNDKPVYTQEMADNGELPPVGSLVVLRYNFDSKTVTHTGIVLFSSDGNCILATEHGESHFRMGDYIYEAIDTRTDEEKLIAEVAKQLHQSYTNATDIVKYDNYFKSDARWLLSKFDIKLK